VARNEAKAAQYHQRGCDGRNLRSCHKLGLLYEKGQGVPKDKAKDVALQQKACDGGFKEACASGSGTK
jgi:TPR repeat protein